MAALDFLKREKVWLGAFATLGVAIVVFAGRTSTPATAPIVWEEKPAATTLAMSGTRLDRVEKSVEDAPTELLVEVSGAVRSPGIFRLKPGLRVFDALDKAGGLLPDADVERLNRVAELKDGMLIRVYRHSSRRSSSVGTSRRTSSRPRTRSQKTTPAIKRTASLPERKEAPKPVPKTKDDYNEKIRLALGFVPEAPTGPDGTVNINLATEADFEKIPGVSHRIAHAIVTYRDGHGRFESIDALMDVPGVSASLLDRIQSHLRL